MFDKEEKRKSTNLFFAVAISQLISLVLFFQQKEIEGESKFSLIKPKMEDMILRFPTVAESIFAELDNASLTKCRKVTNLWASFILSVNC